MFDLGADTQNITHQLGRDRALAPLVRRRPGLRVPGAWDGFELAVRAVLGQQITVAGARKLAAKLVAVHGEPLAPSAAGIAPELAMVFPSPDRLAAVDLAPLGMPRARANALSSLARAACDTPTLFERALDASLDETIQRLTQLPGIGEWTAHYVALRALHDPDAFPAGDVALQRALADPGGTRPSAAQLLARAEAWRPWRAYAAQHLWASDSQPAGASNGARSTR
jgi:3-methyladenine DNA glycosylase/8-oxoguanine DNA glycosylase